MSNLAIGFDKGVSDGVYAAHILDLYRRRGHEVAVHCEGAAAPLFRLAGIPSADPSAPKWEWSEPPDAASSDGSEWQGNVVKWNLHNAPEPRLGSVGELWPELCHLRLDVEQRIGSEPRRQIAGFLRGLARPIILLHLNSVVIQNSTADRPLGIPEYVAELLDNTEGTVVFLDNVSTPRIAHARVRYVQDEWSDLRVDTLCSLLSRSDLLLSTDAEPYHLARVTDVTTIGVWTKRHPSRCTLPRNNTVNLVAKTLHTPSLRVEWNVVECSGETPFAREIATTAERLLAAPRYLRAVDARARDVQLQQWVREWSRSASSLSSYADRHTTVDRLLRETSARFVSPTFVETGTIRMQEDWSAGYSTYVFGAYLDAIQAGQLHSVDFSERNIRCAAEWTRSFAGRIRFHNADSAQWLRTFRERIDVLYLDSADVGVEGFQEHCLAEIEAAAPRLHSGSLVLIDDTTWDRGWIGKGALAVPWLLENGWQVVLSGYQVLLARNGESGSFSLFECGSNGHLPQVEGSREELECTSAAEPTIAEVNERLEHAVDRTQPNWQRSPSVWSAYQEASRALIRALPRYASSHEGRGVVIAAGGERYLTCAWVCVNLLRRNGCRLPIQIWHRGPEELPLQWERIFREHVADVQFQNAFTIRQRHPVRILNGWELKPYAIIHSPFREVIFLDADNVPLIDPELLLELPEYRGIGAIFWPDFGRMAPSREIWSICEVPYRDEPEFETGQIVVDKSRHWDALQLTMHYNEHSDFYYHFIHGDKETFHMAWRRLNDRYAMPSHAIHALEATMCQHDFRGRMIFQHRNFAKWSLAENRRIGRFEREEECLGLIEELAHLLGIRGELTERCRTVDEARQQVAGRRYAYNRIGCDQRPMRLEPDGTISEGSAHFERSWSIRLLNGVVALTISDTQNEPTVHLTQGANGIWRGRWLRFEQVTIELMPISG